MHFVAWFFAGAFLANAVPHFVMGSAGRRFPTPFASPPGLGESSAVVNVLWGFVNLAAGLALLGVGDHGGPLSAAGIATGAGILVMALFVASHFSRNYRHSPD
ncbi:MAG: hypothetical protein ACREQQ_04790 [Candidatus Binatia bacterium]